MFDTDYLMFSAMTLFAVTPLRYGNSIISHIRQILQVFRISFVKYALNFSFIIISS